MAPRDDIEARAGELARNVLNEFAHVDDARWQVVASLIHRAVHLAADGKIEYCKLVTYLSEMIGHAHKVMHGDQPGGNQHRDVLH